MEIKNKSMPSIFRMHDYDIFLEKTMDNLLLNKNNLLNKNPHFKEFF